MAVVSCHDCKKERQVKVTPAGNPRTPGGWKRHQDIHRCGDCWAKLYRLRAVTLPVDSVVEGGTWQEFGLACKAVWGQSTALANWSVNQLALADIVRTPDMEKCPAMPAVNLYRLFQGYAHRAAWQGSAASAQSLMRAVEKKYREKRYEVVWLNAAALPTHSYPVPFPVHNQNWSVEWRTAEHEGRTLRYPVVMLNMAGQRWGIRLRCDNQVSYQLAGLNHIVSGAAVPGELALYRVVSHASHRATVPERAPGGGNRRQTRVMIKLVAWLPQPVQERQRNGVLRVLSTPDQLLCGSMANREGAWLLSHHEARQRIRWHANRMEAIRQDLKAERRPRGQRLAEQEKVEDLCRTHNRYLDTFVKTIAAQLVAFAGRCAVAEIVYNDDDRRFMGELNFPWYKLREQIAYKCESEGLAFRYEGGEDEPEIREGEGGETGPSE